MAGTHTEMLAQFEYDELIIEKEALEADVKHATAQIAALEKSKVKTHEKMRMLDFYQDLQCDAEYQLAKAEMKIRQLLDKFEYCIEK